MSEYKRLGQEGWSSEDDDTPKNKLQEGAARAKEAKGAKGAEVQAGGNTETLGGEGEMEEERSGAERGSGAGAVEEAGAKEGAKEGDDGSDSGNTSRRDFWLLWPVSKGSMARYWTKS